MTNFINLDSFLTKKELIEHILISIDEDQKTYGDISTKTLISSKENVTLFFKAREKGIIAGLVILPILINTFNELYNTNLKINLIKKDGDNISEKEALASITGDLSIILGLERIALNYLSFLSGIASQVNQFKEKISHTKAKIVDTRKTLPTFRGLSKYAVICGGGESHRLGLYDAILWKDNHLHQIPLNELSEKLNLAINSAKEKYSHLKFIEVEVDNIIQLEQVLKTKVDYILLDNMNTDLLKESVLLRDKINPQIKLEASGGVNINNIQNIAETGIDRISIGFLTHSVKALDIGLDF